MTAYVGTVGSGQQTIISIYVGTSGSGQQRVLAGYVGTSGSGQQIFFSGLTASASPSNLISDTRTPGPTTTAPTTVSPANGIGPFTYAWSYVDGDTGISINSPSSSTTSFTGSVNMSNTELDADFNCLVTDTATGATANVPMNVQIIFLGGG